MARSDGQILNEKSLWQWGLVTNVLSATQFQAARLQEYGDGYFAGWSAYVLRDIRSTPAVVAAPQGEQQTASAFTQSGGIVTHPAFTVPMVANDEILMLHPDISNVISGAIAALQAAVGPAATSTLGSLYGILGNPAVPLSSFQGLCYRGIVTNVPGANQFTIAELAGLGGSSFIDLAGINPYYAFVKTIAAGTGAAPQGEAQAITGYATLTGNFTAGAFTVAVGIGDEVLIIHPFLAKILNLAGLPGTNGNLAANWQAAEQTLVTIGAPLTRIKIHNLTIGINALAGNITIRLYTDVNGVERCIFPIPAATTFAVATDQAAIPVINGTMGFRNAVRVTVQSDNAGDNGAVVSYDYLIEAM
jgi:hypothetical protein